MDKTDIVLDVDGVILDFSRGFSKFFNANQTYMQVADVPDLWDYGYEGDDLKYFLDYISKFVDSSPHLEVMDKDWGMVTERLHGKFNLKIITAFPNKKCRIENLEYYNIKYHDIHFPEHIGKADYIAQFDPKIVVEDCPNHVNRLTVLLPMAKIFVPAVWKYRSQINPHENIIFYDTAIELEKLINNYMKI